MRSEKPSSRTSRRALARPRRDLRFVELAHLEAEGHVLRDGHMREEGIALKDHAGVAAPWREICHIDAADMRGAARRLDEARNHAQRRGLSAARRAEQDQELAFGDVEADPVDGVMVAVALREIPELEPRHHTTCEILT